MKKIISMLLALMLICTFCVPAFAAEDEPIEIVPARDINIFDSGNYIIKGREYRGRASDEIKNLIIYENATLTITNGARICVTENFTNDGTIYLIDGYLNIETEYAMNRGVIKEINCCTGEVKNPSKILGNPVEYYNHLYEDGVCIACGYECPHEFGLGGKCIECDVYCSHTQTHMGTVCDCCGTEVESTTTGSILSHGYPEIVYGIGGIAIGVVATLLISRKKKATVSSTSTDDEE